MSKILILRLMSNVPQIIIIIIAMSAWDFVVGILVGIVLACINFVLQSSQISAIRATLHGGIANSTVRRHPVQQRFLQTVGPQIRVIKLAGYLFFGTVVGVEKQIRALLLDEALSSQPIQFLVVDLAKVDGIDYSAAEAFLRLNRILKTKNIKLFMCGFASRNDIGQSLENVGILNTDGGVDTFENLNSSLEYCENNLLKTFYRRRDALEEDPSNQQYLGKLENIFSSLKIILTVRQIFHIKSRHFFPVMECSAPPGETSWRRLPQQLSENTTEPFLMQSGNRINNL